MLANKTLYKTILSNGKPCKLPPDSLSSRVDLDSAARLSSRPFPLLRLAGGSRSALALLRELSLSPPSLSGRWGGPERRGTHRGARPGAMIYGSRHEDALELVTGIPEHVSEAVRRCGISTCHKLLSVSELELVEMLDMFLSDVRELVALVSAACAPSPQTAQQLLRSGALSTGIDELDAHLGGGLRLGSVTEIVGPSSVGKTQLCLAVTAEALVVGHSQSAGVVYVDTERSFCAVRLMALIKRALQKHGVVADTDELMFRVNVISGDGWEGYEQCLHRLQAQLQGQQATTLLVVDSIAAPARGHFERSKLVERQRILAGHTALFKSIAEDERMAVLVTNQVMALSHMQSDAVDDGVRDLARIHGLDEDLSACLGTSWAHCVNVRLVMQFHAEDSQPKGRRHHELRELRVAKANFCAERTFPFTVTESGLESASVVATPPFS